MEHLPPWQLRPAQPADLPAMAALESAIFGRSAWTQAMLAEELAAPMRHYLVVETLPSDQLPLTAVEPTPFAQAAQIAAFGGIRLLETADIMTIEVAPAWRGRGLGRGIMTKLILVARHASCQAIMLEVKIDNAPAIGLYQSLGFVKIGLRRGYYQPENADAFTMRLELAHRSTRCS